MDTQKARFTASEIELIGALREQASEPKAKVAGLFRETRDPLLSAPEVAALLGLSHQESQQALSELVKDSTLEESTDTIRALDESEGVALYRSKGTQFHRLRLFATETRLNDGSTRLQFSCEGRLVRCIARVDRLDALTGEGQQREEVRSHIEDIAKGIEDGNQVPNAILLVIDQNRVATEDDAPESFLRIRQITDWSETLVPGTSDSIAQVFRHVELDFPFRIAAFDEEKLALLVDGQQRTAALSLVDIEKVPHFYLTVNAVVADKDAAKLIFQIANSTVKISTQFSRALTASMSDAPASLRQERVKAVATKALCLDVAESPFWKLVQYPGAQVSPKPPLAYNSMFQVVSIFADSALSLEEDPSRLTKVVARAFDLVKKAWPNAWGKKPSESRLMHGAGLRAVGHLLAEKLSQICYSTKELNAAAWAELGESLDRLKNVVIWTDSEMADASKLARKNYKEHIADRQNTSQDIAELARWLSKESLDLDTKARKSGA